MKNIFDFIVVGAGSAGCAVAANLSESGRFSVLLIEAGGEATNKWIRVPIGIGRLLQNKEVLWDYKTEPDTSMKGQQHYWPRGKLLGGSSSVNGKYLSAETHQNITLGQKTIAPDGDITMFCPFSKRWKIVILAMKRLEENLDQ